MRRSPRERLLYALSLACAAVPFVFALIRTLQTGSDRRFLWMALAAFLGGSGVMAIALGRRRTSAPGLLAAVAAFAAAVVLAGSTAFALGATSAPAVWVVAVAFALCWAAYYTLNVRSRPRPL
jgi:hypothetical protein